MKNPFSYLFRARDKPQNAVSAAPSFYFGMSGSGKSVSPSSAIQVSAVYACVRVIAETIASLPFHVYEATDEGSRKAIEHPLYRLIHDEPNLEMTSFIWRETMLTHLLLYVQFNLDGLMRGDYKSRMEGYAIARQNGWMSTNDIRELENLNPVSEEEGGNAYLVNGNMIPISLAGLGVLMGLAIQENQESSQDTGQDNGQDAPEEETKPEENEPPKRGRRKAR